jgi:hypothetical protein
VQLGGSAHQGVSAQQGVIVQPCLSTQQGGSAQQNVYALQNGSLQQGMSSQPNVYFQQGASVQQGGTLVHSPILQGGLIQAPAQQSGLTVQTLPLQGGLMQQMPASQVGWGQQIQCIQGGLIQTPTQQSGLIVQTLPLQGGLMQQMPASQVGLQGVFFFRHLHNRASLCRLQCKMLHMPRHLCNKMFRTFSWYHSKTYSGTALSDCFFCLVVHYNMLFSLNKQGLFFKKYYVYGKFRSSVSMVK